MQNQIFANQTDKQYHELLQRILEEGVVHSEERTGTGTKAIFGHMMRFKMSDGLPLLTTKKMYIKGIVGELLWFLGNHMQDERYTKLPVDNIRYLLDNNIEIWVGDCYKAYTKRNDDIIHEFSKEEFVDLLKTDDEFSLVYGGIGAGYGWQWRHFGGDYTTYNQSFNSFYLRSPSFVEGINMGVDQIKELIKGLKTNPTGRRHIVTAWNPTDLDKTTLPPCHYGFSCYVRELSIEDRWDLLQNKEWSKPFNQVSTDDLELKRICDEYNIPKYALSLMERQRSVDVFLGLPFNIASYAILLHIIAREVNMVPDELIMSLENTHLYLNHMEAVKTQLNRTSQYNLPSIELKFAPGAFNKARIEDIIIHDYKSDSTIPAPLNN